MPYYGSKDALDNRKLMILAIDIWNVLPKGIWIGTANAQRLLLDEKNQKSFPVRTAQLLHFCLGLGLIEHSLRNGTHKWRKLDDEQALKIIEKMQARIDSQKPKEE